MKIIDFQAYGILPTPRIQVPGGAIFEAIHGSVHECGGIYRIEGRLSCRQVILERGLEGQPEPGCAEEERT